MSTSSSSLLADQACGECVHAERCRWLLGDDYSPKSQQCDWDPSRFVRNTKPNKEKKDENNRTC